MKGSPHDVTRRVLLSLSILSLALATACAQPAADATPAPDTTAAVQPPAAAYTTDDVVLASAKIGLPPTTITPADLPDPESQGAQYVVRFCSRCHTVPSPAMHSATDWPGVTRRMWMRMARMDPVYAIPVPEVGDQLVILNYLTANALRVSAANLPDFPGREQFQTTCSECHELADPKQHSPADWYVVVRRMNQHMREILGQELTSEEVQEIVLYLEKASA